MLTPSFHFQILEQFIDVFNSNASILVQRLKQEVGVSSFDVYPYGTLCALDVICETAMGTPINAQLNANSEYVKAVSKISSIIPKRIVNPLIHSDFIYKFSALYKEEQKVVNIALNYQNNIIENRRKQLIEEQKNKSASNTNNDDIGLKKKMPFLDTLLQATVDGKPFTPQELSDEVSTFMFAGHDTTSSALSFALYSLGHYPEVQKKAFEELNKIFGGDKERPCTLQDINEMKYLELIIKETLRLYPSAPIFTRKLNEDVTVDGITYPKGLTIGIFAYGVHHDEDYYENAEEFDPNRFSKERYDGKRPFTYIPFSAGPRNCLGQKFAMMEMKALLSSVLRNYEMVPAKPHHALHLGATIVLKADNEVFVAIKERKY